LWQVFAFEQQSRTAFRVFYFVGFKVNFKKMQLFSHLPQRGEQRYFYGYASFARQIWAYFTGKLPFGVGAK
jgi:hypothetical protein